MSKFDNKNIIKDRFSWLVPTPLLPQVRELGNHRYDFKIQVFDPFFEFWFLKQRGLQYVHMFSKNGLVAYSRYDYALV